MHLYTTDNNIQKLEVEPFGEVLKELKDWFSSSEKDPEKVATYWKKLL